MAFSTTLVTLGTAVANAGTVTVAYPAGTTQAAFIGANAAANTGLAILNDNEVIPEAASGVRVNFTYGASDITVTNNTGLSWPAGTRVRLQFGRAGNDRPVFQRAPAITSITDNSGGTASDTVAAIGGTYNQAEVRNAVASLAAKLNQVLAHLRSEGDITP